jgi:hypothetical protein
MPQIILPEDQYPFATEVPKKGASCATCKYLDKKLCTNPYYIEWNSGSGELRKKPKRWCCSAWTQG